MPGGHTKGKPINRFRLYLCNIETAVGTIEAHFSFWSDSSTHKTGPPLPKANFLGDEIDRRTIKGILHTTAVNTTRE